MVFVEAALDFDLKPQQFWAIAWSMGDGMQISVSDAKAQLTDLVHRAEAGDKIVLTRHGQPVARLVPIKGARNRKARLSMVEVMRQVARGQALQGLGAEQYRDFVAGADGLPKWVRLRKR